MVDLESEKIKRQNTEEAKISSRNSGIQARFMKFLCLQDNLDFSIQKSSFCLFKPCT